MLNAPDCAELVQQLSQLAGGGAYLGDALECFRQAGGPHRRGGLRTVPLMLQKRCGCRGELLGMVSEIQCRHVEAEGPNLADEVFQAPVRRA